MLLLLLLLLLFVFNRTTFAFNRAVLAFNRAVLRIPGRQQPRPLHPSLLLLVRQTLLLQPLSLHALVHEALDVVDEEVLRGP
jgi:hypothetical protein